jgi:hypothetical protein
MSKVKITKLKNKSGDLISITDRGDGTGYVQDHEHAVTRFDGPVDVAMKIGKQIAGRKRDDIAYE